MFFMFVCFFLNVKSQVELMGFMMFVIYIIEIVDRVIVYNNKNDAFIHMYHSIT